MYKIRRGQDDVIVNLSLNINHIDTPPIFRYAECGGFISFIAQTWLENCLKTAWNPAWNGLKTLLISFRGQILEIPQNTKTQIFVSIWHKFAFFNPKFNPSLCQIDTNPTQKHKFAQRPPHVEQICVGQHKDTTFLLKILQTGLSVPAWSGDQRYPYSNHITAFVEKVITFFYIRENSY